ncbi:MAG TPA: hypothetical protein PLX89_03485 [Verrucomicrobiota bacterium]|nr:hypothetical protein [Verrucomicrobiales bacterium]HRI12046.1 hypothetical protein [Verrucomicrobiota bacterium]
MSTKVATADSVNGSKTESGDTVEKYLAEMASIRRRMKSTDSRIRRADASIRRDLDATRLILCDVQTVR